MSKKGSYCFTLEDRMLLNNTLIWNIILFLHSMVHGSGLVHVGVGLFFCTLENFGIDST